MIVGGTVIEGTFKHFHFICHNEVLCRKIMLILLTIVTFDKGLVLQDFFVILEKAGIFTASNFRVLLWSDTQSRVSLIGFQVV